MFYVFCILLHISPRFTQSSNLLLGGQVEGEEKRVSNPVPGEEFCSDNHASDPSAAIIADAINFLYDFGYFVLFHRIVSLDLDQ